jgi:hypothetical protein
VVALLPAKVLSPIVLSPSPSTIENTVPSVLR